jgi:hypothetical protein
VNLRLPSARRAIALALIAVGLASVAQSSEAQGPLSANRDFNGDGLSDVVLDLYDPVDEDVYPWVVFGKRDTASVDHGAIGTAGFRVGGDCSTAAAVGDIDGDGFGELAMSCVRPGHDSREVIVVSPRAASGVLDPFDPSRPALRIDGERLTDPAPVGDINGDHRADLVVSGPFRHKHRSDYLIFGRSLPGTIDVKRLGSSGVVVRGPRHRSSSDFADPFGVSGAGDIDGDGIGDVVIGDALSPERSCGGNSEHCRGRVWVVFGASQLPARVSLPRLPSPGFAIRPSGTRRLNNIGETFGSAGDLDGDGYDDLLVGASLRFESVPFVVWGGPRRHARGRLLSLRRSHLRVKGGANLFITPIGDLNGDGRDDLTASEPDLAPSLKVIFGRRWRGELPAGRARPPGIRALIPTRHGRVLMTGPAGDVNSDGIPDLVVDRTDLDDSYGSSQVDFVIFGRRPLQPVQLGALGRSGFVIR